MTVIHRHGVLRESDIIRERARLAVLNERAGPILQYGGDEIGEGGSCAGLKRVESVGYLT